MHKPWYSFLYVKSPITKIVMGTVALLITLALLVFQWRIEEPRMSAQTASWNGRTIENGAALYSSNCVQCHGGSGEGASGPALNSRYFFTNRVMDAGFTGTLHDYVAGTVAAGRPSGNILDWGVKMPTWSNRFGGPMRDDQVLAVTAFVMNWESEALQQEIDEDPWRPFPNAPMTQVTGEVIQPESSAPSDEPRPPDELFVAMGCQACHVLDKDQPEGGMGDLTGPNLGNLHETAATHVEGQDALAYVVTSIAKPSEFIHPGYVSPSAMTATFSMMMTEEEITALAQWVLDQAAAN